MPSQELTAILFIMTTMRRLSYQDSGHLAQGLPVFNTYRADMLGMHMHVQGVFCRCTFSTIINVQQITLSNTSIDRTSCCP